VAVAIGRSAKSIVQATKKEAMDAGRTFTIEWIPFHDDRMSITPHIVTFCELFLNISELRQPFSQRTVTLSLPIHATKIAKPKTVNPSGCDANTARKLMA
jgi:hypothetical protein